MAYEIGTATNYKDLLAKLRTFLTTGLGADNWTSLRYDTNLGGTGEYELILQGPGSGSDEIFVGIQTYSSVGGDYYNWKMAGFTGYSAGALFANQPGVTTGRWPRMLLWNQNIPYWFAANGRCIKVVAKVSSVYESCYMGFGLPYGLPTQFPYPLVIGASGIGSNTANERYSTTESEHRGFANPYAAAAEVCTSVTSDSGNNATLKVLLGTSWVTVRNRSGSSSYVSNCVWPYISTDQEAGVGYWFSKIKNNIDGSYPVFPLTICLSVPNKHIFGELEGCFAVPGFGGVAAEDTFVIGGVTYVAFPIVPNAAANDFWALKLE